MSLRVLRIPGEPASETLLILVAMFLFVTRDVLIVQALAPSLGALAIEASGADATIGVLTLLALTNVVLIGLLWAVCRPRALGT